MVIYNFLVLNLDHENKVHSRMTKSRYKDGNFYINSCRAHGILNVHVNILELAPRTTGGTG